MLHSKALLVALVLLAAPVFAGCLGGEVEDDSPVDAAANETSESLAVGEFATGGLGARETNRTVEGSGGEPHIHDYWEGRQKVTLLERSVQWDPWPVFVDGNPSGGRIFQAYFELPPETLVFEGTGLLQVTAKALRPAEVPLHFQFKSARGNDWSEAIPIKPGAPVEIEVTPLTADSPHSVRSLWAFRYVSDAGARVMPPTSEIDTEVVAFRARNIDAWPGHPDFYAERPFRVVLDGEFSTSVDAFTDTNLYGVRGQYIPSEFLISMGTTRLEVFVNVTGYNGLPTTEPGDYYLVYRHPNLTRSQNHDYHYNRDQDGGTFVQFSNLTVDHFQHDPPYAESSRWAFRVNTYVGDACGNCNAYELRYHITVVAWNDDRLRELEEAAAKAE